MPQDNIIRIAFIHFSRSNYSGGQKNIFRLIANLDKNCFKVILITNKHNTLVQKLTEIGIQCEIVKLDPILELQDKKLLSYNPFQLYSTLKSIYRYRKDLIKCLTEYPVDIVWCENIRMLLTSFLAIKHFRTPVVWNIWSEERGYLARLLYMIGACTADSINYEYSNQNERIFGLFKNFTCIQKKAYILYSGVTEENPANTRIREELGLSDNDCIFFMASNIYPLKGQLDLVHSMVDIHKNAPQAKLILAGSPLKDHSESEKYHNRLQEIIKERNALDYIFLLGWRTDIVDLIQASDVYVSSSYSEGMPDSIREAMRLEKPIIAADVGGIGELVGDDCGLLFPAGDIHHLKQLMLFLYSNQSERVKFGANGRAKIEKYFSNASYALQFTKMVHKVKKIRGN